VSPAVEAAVADAFRTEWGSVVAAIIRLTDDWDLAEECAQDAFARALERWPRDGVPVPGSPQWRETGRSTGCAATTPAPPGFVRRRP